MNCGFATLEKGRTENGRRRDDWLGIRRRRKEKRRRERERKFGAPVRSRESADTMGVTAWRLEGRGKSGARAFRFKESQCAGSSGTGASGGRRKQLRRGGGGCEYLDRHRAAALPVCLPFPLVPAGMKGRRTRRRLSLASGALDSSSREGQVSAETKAGRLLSAFFRFTRPHTMFGTAVSISSVSLLALRDVSDFNVKFVIGALAAISSALAMNITIVGLNQLYDIEIDKVNKPYLPLASGEFSVFTGQVIVVASALISLAIGKFPFFPSLSLSGDPWSLE